MNFSVHLQAKKKNESSEYKCNQIVVNEIFSTSMFFRITLKCIYLVFNMCIDILYTLQIVAFGVCKLCISMFLYTSEIIDINTVPE